MDLAPEASGGAPHAAESAAARSWAPGGRWHADEAAARDASSEIGVRALWRGRRRERRVPAPPFSSADGRSRHHADRSRGRAQHLSGEVERFDDITERAAVTRDDTDPRTSGAFRRCGACCTGSAPNAGQQSERRRHPPRPSGRHRGSVPNARRAGWRSWRHGTTTRTSGAPPRSTPSMGSEAGYVRDDPLPRLGTAVADLGEMTS